MDIQYKNNKIRNICTDLTSAKKKINIYSEKLHSLINVIENAKTLKDIDAMRIYYLHKINKDEFALDIAGRRVPWRLIIIPLDEKRDRWKTNDINIIYKSTKALIIWEVSKHYEKYY